MEDFEKMRQMLDESAFDLNKTIKLMEISEKQLLEVLKDEDDACSVNDDNDYPCSPSDFCGM